MNHKGTFEKKGISQIAFLMHEIPVKGSFSYQQKLLKQHIKYQSK
jgi:hypothetical protein